VAAVASGDDPVPSEKVRVKAFQLLGRDSESLSERNFGRILKDAHDAGMVDLRKRGEAFEVTAVAGAPTIADQLAIAEKAHAPVKAASAPAPRGMGVRSAPGRGGRTTAKPALPPGLFLGMVEEPETAIPAASTASGATEDDASEAKPAKKAAKKRVAKPKAAGDAKPKAAKKAAKKSPAKKAKAEPVEV
jgi:hypothetical protein